MITISYTDGKNMDFIALCKQLDTNLNQIIGAGRQEIYDQYNLLHDIKDVWIAYENNTSVGCAAFKHYDANTVEVKRVFVRPEHRKKGISRMLMACLEKRAQEMGYTLLILETGRSLKEAINLYQSSGFTVIENYGQYKDLPESVCMQKKLPLYTI